MSAPPCSDRLPAQVRLIDQLIGRLSQWRSLVRCTPQAVFRGACGVLLLSAIGGVLGGMLAGLLAGLLVRASFTGVKRCLVFTCILAAAGGTTGGVLAAANELDSVLSTVIGGGSLLILVLSPMVPLVFVLALGVWWLLRALCIIDDEVETQQDVLRRLCQLLPPDEAALWRKSNIGYLADITDPRERRLFLRSLTVHMPRLVWASWSIHLRCRSRTRGLDISELGVDRDVPAVTQALLTLSRRDFRAFLRGTPITVRLMTGRLLTVRYQGYRR
jgi:hypothetical protein